MHISHSYDICLVETLLLVNALSIYTSRKDHGNDIENIKILPREVTSVRQLFVHDVLTHDDAADMCQSTKLHRALTSFTTVSQLIKNRIVAILGLHRCSSVSKTQVASFHAKYACISFSLIYCYFMVFPLFLINKCYTMHKTVLSKLPVTSFFHVTHHVLI